MKVKFTNFLNEEIIVEKTIIFKDFCEIYFSGNIDAMIEWLNENLKNREVYFIFRSLDILQRKFRVEEYKNDHFHHDDISVEVLMTNGQHGSAGGLVYLNLDLDSENIKLPNTKYKKIKNIELDPFDEDDWGYEEIQ